MTGEQMLAGTDSANRERQAAAWVASRLGRESVDLEPVSGDASFRRYFRVRDGEQSLVVMDAPPAKEHSAPFVDIAHRLRNAGLLAPEILHFDLEQGFGLLEDFGDTLFRDVLDENTVDFVFTGLFDILETMATEVVTEGLPRYHSLKLQQELSLFTDWYLRVHRDRLLTNLERLDWNQVCVRLINSAREQPQVFVHRDFHSCNLLQTPSGQPGIIDFQDGVHGPVSYDLVSLLWDRYISWPRDRLEHWMMQMYERLQPSCKPSTWIRWCDLMGLQRNLKIVGIFARLHYRDEKQGYLEMIPRFYQYLLDVCPRYPELKSLQRLLETAECAP